MKESFLTQLQKGIVLFDGGLGSLLQARGLPAGVLPEVWNLTHPEVLTAIHREYLAAGADVVTANTFGANPFKFRTEAADALPSADGAEEKARDGADAGAYTLQEVVTAAVKCAKAAAREAGRGFVALDLGPTGRLLEPMGDMAFEDCVNAYAEVIRIGAAAGADLVLIETMSDLYELKAAVLAAKEACDLPVAATVAFDASGKLLTGGTPRAVVALLEGLRVDALGLNCGLGPDDMAGVAKELLAYASVPVIVQPNAGLPRTEAGRTVYDLGAEDFATGMRAILAMGARGIGGCCGTTPAHIRALHELRTTNTSHSLPLEGKVTPQEPDEVSAIQNAKAASLRDATLVTSFADAVEIGADPVIIGERINPTGKKRLEQALRDADMEYILQTGLAQQRQGAHILDVNVGVPGTDEPALLTQVVKELQSVTELPLQLDSADPEALARAMRVYNGKPLINSVNGKQAVMDAVFPLVAKYGGVVVALTLDEDGIPDTAEGRVQIAKRMIEQAAAHGIQKKDLLIDALCMTVSTDERNAQVTLESVRRIRQELQAKTVLGVSNVSFGLPARDVINASFFLLALECGLNAAIINPQSAEMMRAFHAFRALKGLDPHLSSYIAAVPALVQSAPPGEKKEKRVSVKDTLEGEDDKSALYRAIRNGLKEQAALAAREALTARDAVDIVDSEMMTALDDVGRGFEAGSIFLPQLIMSAEAAKAAFEVIRTKMTTQGRTERTKGDIILATVKGDIHDIGKNIVKVLLENYNYNVIDLGRDVPPERILEAVQLHGVRMVGLSALMTTTVPAMEETICLLRDKAPDVRVIVGGAVLTQEVADRIGADYYAKDAMATVSLLEEVFRTGGGR